MRTFDAANYLETEEDIAIYLDEIVSLNDPALFAEALGDVARARGMKAIAEKTGKSREGLYQSFSKQGNPSFATTQQLLDSIGLQFHIAPKKIVTPST